MNLAIGDARYIAVRLIKDALLRIPGVSRLTWKHHGHRTGAMFDASNVLGILSIHLRALENAGLGLEGLRAVELGPGNTLAQAFLLCMLGAREVLAVDVRPYVATEAERNVYRACLEKLEPWLEEQRFSRRLLQHGWSARAEALLDSYTGVPVLGGALRYEITDGLHLPRDDRSVDLVYCCSVLEHVVDPVGVYREIARVVRPGGLVSVSIDVSDHHHADPFNFLRYGERLWNLMQGRSAGYTNRLRACEHLRLLRESGFEVLEERRRLAEHWPPHASVVPRFRSMSLDELRTLDVVVSAVRGL